MASITPAMKKKDTSKNLKFRRQDQESIKGDGKKIVGSKG